MLDVSHEPNRRIKLMLRRFHFERTKDHSGVSGVGRVAEGVLFTDTQEVVVHWLGKHACINIYHSISDVLTIHGHSGSTVVVWDDPEETN
jgi:hypothetical protein